MPRRQGGSHKEQTPKELISGIIQITRGGRGFLPWPDAPEKEDIEIKTEDLRGALNGDEVEAELTALFPRPKGKIKKVITRAKEEFVATLKRLPAGDG